MKKLAWLLLAISISIFAIVKHKVDSQHKKPEPTGTKIIVKEKEDGGKNRKLWIEQMHKSAPDVNWKKVDLETRKNKMNMRSSSKSSKYISIADGELSGTWRETGSNNLSGRTHFVEYDSITDSIYCASSGGNIWKASKYGDGWHVLNDGFQIPDIKMVKKIPNDGNYRLLVSSGEWGFPGFWYSDNDGTTWNNSTGLTSIESYGSVIRTMVANTDLYRIYLLALEWDYDNWEKITCLYISEDKGESFLKTHAFRESELGPDRNFDIWIDPKGSSTLYLLAGQNIYSLDEANDTSLINTIDYDVSEQLLLCGAKNDSTTYLYVGAYNEGSTSFYQSTDAGINWTEKGIAPTGPFFKNSLMVSQQNPEYLYYGGMECFRSEDGGLSWTKVNDWGEYYNDMPNKLHADIPGINSFIDSNNNEFVYINTDGGTYISEDHLETVSNISLNNLNVGQFYSVYSHRTNSNYIFGGSQDQGYQLCNNNDSVGVEDFEQIISGDYGHIVSGDGGNSIWMVYPGFAAYYPNAISDPDNMRWWYFTCNGQYWIPPLMEDPEAPNKVFMGGGSTNTGAHLFHLTATGNNISVEEVDYDFSGTSESTAISAMAYSPIDNNYRYVMNGNGDFFISTDGGNSWLQKDGFNGPDGNYLYGATIIPSQTEPEKVYVGGSGYSNAPVYVLNNHSVNFTPMDNGLPNTMVFEMAITPNDEFIFAATEVGPYVYIQEEGEWFDMAQSTAPDQTYWTVDYQPLTKTARFGTYGRGIWDFNIESETASIESLTANRALLYPNPAKDFIHVNSNGELIQIYDINGQLMLETIDPDFGISEFRTGIYIVKAGNQSQKLIKR